MHALEINHRAGFGGMLVRRGLALGSQITSCVCSAVDFYLRDRTLMWTTHLPPILAANHISYFIPVDRQFENVAAAMRAVYAELESGTYTRFAPDSCMEMRFLRSSRALLAPCYSEDPDQLFFAANLPFLQTNLYPTDSREYACAGAEIQKLNHEFRRFMYRVEAAWMRCTHVDATGAELSAAPHTAKLFGFRKAADGRVQAFDPSALEAAIPEQRRKLVRERVLAADPAGVFRSSFVETLLGIPLSGEDGAYDPNFRPAPRRFALPWPYDFPDLVISCLIIVGFVLVALVRTAARVLPAAAAASAIFVAVGFLRL